MELKLRDGDYVPDGTGGLEQVSGQEALAQRVMFRLCARRGGLPFLDTMGSQLHLLGRFPRDQRQSAAIQYVSEALAEEKAVSVQAVTLTEEGNEVRLRVNLQGPEAPFSVVVTLP